MFSTGTLVWAKQRTWSAWPAVVAPTSSGQTHKGTGKKAQTHVIFLEYGMQHAWVLNKNIKEFTRDNYKKNRRKTVKSAVEAAIGMLDIDIDDRLAVLDEGWEENADILIEEEMNEHVEDHNDNVYAIFNGMKNATADKGHEMDIDTAVDVMEEAENIEASVDVVEEAELETDSPEAVDGGIEVAVEVVEEAELETDSPKAVDSDRKMKRKRKRDKSIKLVVNPLYGRRTERMQRSSTALVGNQTWENGIQDSSSRSASQDRPSSQNDRQASTSSQSARSSSQVNDESSSSQNVGQGEASYQNHNTTSQSVLQNNSSSENNVKITFEMSDEMWSKTLDFGIKFLKATTRSDNNN